MFADVELNNTQMFTYDEEYPAELNAYFDCGNFLDEDLSRFPVDPCSSWESELFPTTSSDFLDPNAYAGVDVAFEDEFSKLFELCDGSVLDQALVCSYEQPSTAEISTLPLTNKFIKEEPDLESSTIPGDGVTNSVGKWRRSLIGVVISCGPGNHLATFEVITDNESECLSDEDIGENKSFGDLNEDAMFNQGMDTVEDFDEAAQIVEAVQFHFSQHESHSNPKIVPSYKIKDALPKEVIDSIKAASLHSRTIAIVEPISKSSQIGEASTSAQPCATNEVDKLYPSKQSTRFQDAALGFGRTKHALASSLSSTSQAPVALDHDYCSSGSKVSKRHFRHIKEEAISHQAKAFCTDLHKLKSTIKIKHANSVQTITLPTVKSFLNRPKSSFPIISRIGKYSKGSSPIQIRLAKSASTSTSLATCPIAKSNETEKIIVKDEPECEEMRDVDMPVVDDRISDLIENEMKYLNTVSANNNSNFDFFNEESFSPGFLEENANPDYKLSSPETLNECDIRKDSGLESGDLSDSSELGQIEDKSGQWMEFAENSERNDESQQLMKRKTLSFSRSSFRLKRNHSSSSTSSSCSTKSTGDDRIPKSSNMPKKKIPRKLSNCVTQRKSYSNRCLLNQDLRTEIEEESHRLETVEEMGQQDSQVVYVGKIAEGTTQSELRQKFEKFGHILEISLHFIESGRNYALVTFKHKIDAITAIGNGKEDPDCEKLDICLRST